MVDEALGHLPALVAVEVHAHGIRGFPARQTAQEAHPGEDHDQGQGHEQESQDVGHGSKVSSPDGERKGLLAPLPEAPG